MFLLIVAVIVVFAALIAMICVESVRRTSPTNLIVLSIFTLGETYLVGASTMRFDSEDVSATLSSYSVQCFRLIVFSIGATSYWHNRSGMHRTDDIRLPDKMGLYDAGRCLIRSGNHSIFVRSHRNVFPR